MQAEKILFWYFVSLYSFHSLSLYSNETLELETWREETKPRWNDTFIEDEVYLGHQILFQQNTEKKNNFIHLQP